MVRSSLIRTNTKINVLYILIINLKWKAKKLQDISNDFSLYLIPDANFHGHNQDINLKKCLHFRNFVFKYSLLQTSPPSFSSVCQVTPILLFMETSSPWTYHNLKFLSPISLLAGSASMVLLPVPPSTSFVFIWVEERHNQGISLVLPPKQLDIWGPYNPGQYVHFKFMAIFPTNHTDFYWPVFPLL